MKLEPTKSEYIEIVFTEDMSEISDTTFDRLIQVLSGTLPERISCDSRSDRVIYRWDDRCGLERREVEEKVRSSCLRILRSGQC